MEILSIDVSLPTFLQNSWHQTGGLAHHWRDKALTERCLTNPANCADARRSQNSVRQYLQALGLGYTMASEKPQCQLA